MTMWKNNGTEVGKKSMGVVQKNIDAFRKISVLIWIGISGCMGATSVQAANVRHFTLSDAPYLACLVRAEAEGECQPDNTKGMSYVASVMHHRGWSWNQAAFSAANRNDLAAFCARSPGWAVHASTELVDGLLRGRTQPAISADHYVTLALYHSPRCPKWAKAMRVVKMHKNHVFLASKSLDTR